MKTMVAKLKLKTLNMLKKMMMMIMIFTPYLSELIG